MGTQEYFEVPLRSILQLLAEQKVPHVIIGGLAVSQLGRPRMTADIDILALLEDDDRIPALLKAAEGSGFAPRITDAVRFARKNRVLLLEHRQTGVPVDISLGLLPFEREVLQRSSVVTIGDMRIPLPSVEDLVILKAVAHRPIDLQDMRALVSVHPNLDRDRVRTIVSEFAGALDMPELLEDLLEII